MSRSRASGRLAALCSLLLVTGTLAVGAPAVAATGGDYPASYAAAELIRATNADRVALGLPALARDPALAELARERAFPCPYDPALLIRGRARDIAERGYGLNEHRIAGCTDPASGRDVLIFDVAAAAGYTGWSRMGENIGYTANDPTTPTRYATGCDRSGANCRGEITLPADIAHVQRLYMGSPAHRGIITGDWTQFGCGAWSADGVTVYTTCLFAVSTRPVDSSGPLVTTVSGRAGAYLPDVPLAFSISVDDRSRGRSRIAVADALLDGVRIARFREASAGMWTSFQVETPGLPIGAHELVWRVRDLAGNRTEQAVRFAVRSPALDFVSPDEGSIRSIDVVPGPVRRTIDWTEAYETDASAATRTLTLLMANAWSARGCRSATWRVGPSYAIPFGVTARSVGFATPYRCYRFRLAVTDSAGRHTTRTSGTLFTRP